jgi:exoribonuclease R
MPLDLPITRALISVSDKSGLIDFARGLANLGVEILSTGGTAKALAQAGIAVIDVSQVTGFPEIMDGRVKTLHPKVHGGLLSIRGNAEHEAARAIHSIVNIDLLAVNLYPFEQARARQASYDESVENIDIGGPAMIRAAAKNHDSVTVLVEPSDYTDVLDEMRAHGNATTFQTRRKLAARVLKTWVEDFVDEGEPSPGTALLVAAVRRDHLLVEQKGKAWVEPREPELGLIDVPKTQLARPGDLVKVRLGVGEKLLQGHEHRLVGEVSGSLGAEADHSVEVLSIAFSRGFHDEFPDDVMDEADAFPLELTEADLEGRRDLRTMQLVTIDGEDARDFDDAIFVEPTDAGWRLVVAIADVSHYVTPKSALDAEGLHRATSVYLPGRVLPMLPERIPRWRPDCSAHPPRLPSVRASRTRATAW